MDEHQALLDLFDRGLRGRQRERLRQACPQLLLAILRVVVETLTGLFTQSSQLVHHAVADVVDGAALVGLAEVGGGLFPDARHQFERDFVGQRQRPHRHAGHAPGVVDQRRLHAFGQQRQAFADVGREHPAGVEAAAVIDDDGRLEDRLDEVHGTGQAFITGGLAANDLHQRHLVDWREEMQADEIGRTCGRLGQPADGQGGGVGGQDGAGGDHRLGLARHVGLDGAVFKHRFDHDVTACQVGEVGGRFDQGELGITLGLGHALGGHALVPQVLAVGLALGRAVGAAVEQHHFHADLGGGEGNARAHHASPQNADLAVAGLRHALGPGGQLAGGGNAKEQRVNHVLGLFAGRQLDELAHLDLAAGVDVDLAAVVDAVQDRLGRGIVAKGLGAQHGVACGEGFVAHGALHGAARQLETLAVPGLNSGSGTVGQQPLLGAGQQLVGRHDFIDQTRFQGFFRGELFAFEQEGQRVAHADHARQTLRAASARQ